MAGSAQAVDPTQSFDVYAAYHAKLSELPPGLAAVSGLTTALTEHRFTTASEAISLLSTLEKTLKARLKNPIPASAGTDAFLHTLVTTVARPGVEESSDSDQIVNSIRSYGDQFIQLGLEATRKLARYGRKLVQDGNVVVAISPDDAVLRLLKDAVQAGVRFKAVVVENNTRDVDAVETLRKAGISTASIQTASLAHTLSILSAGPSANVNSPLMNDGVLVIASAAAVLSSGGVMAPVGTLQACIVAQQLGIRTYIACETWKSVRLLPFGGEETIYGEPLQWKVLSDDSLNGKVASHETLTADLSDQHMDITPAKCISGIITERGIHPSSTFSEDSIKFWF